VKFAVDSAKVLDTLLAAVKADDSAVRYVTVLRAAFLPVICDQQFVSSHTEVAL